MGLPRSCPMPTSHLACAPRMPGAVKHALPAISMPPVEWPTFDKPVESIGPPADPLNGTAGRGGPARGGAARAAPQAAGRAAGCARGKLLSGGVAPPGRGGARGRQARHRCRRAGSACGITWSARAPSASMVPWTAWSSASNCIRDGATARPSLRACTYRLSSGSTDGRCRMTFAMLRASPLNGWGPALAVDTGNR